MDQRTVVGKGRNEKISQGPQKGLRGHTLAEHKSEFSSNKRFHSSTDTVPMGKQKKNRKIVGSLSFNSLKRAATNNNSRVLEC